MDEPVTVSCIVPTHARPSFLEDALRSIVTQTRLPDEIVVVSDVDDAQSERVCAAYGDRIPGGVRYLRSTGSPGASGSRNAGAHAATGDLYAFLDDDDKWTADYLSDALRALDETDADCVVTWLRMFRDGATAPGLHIQPGVVAARAAADNPGVTGSNIVLRREAFERIDGFDVDLPVKNDGDFFFRFLSAGLSYAVNAREQVLQRKHSSGQLTGRTEARAAGLELYLRKHRDVLTLSDRRTIRLAAARIRYHAATSTAGRIRQLAIGAFNSSPASIVASVRNRRSRDFWLVEGFGDQAASSPSE